MLTRVIARSPAFRPLALTHDDELDAALALSGCLDLPRGTRYCFQTTYLNERYREYARLLPRQKLIWVLRNPRSVVYSMIYNWRRWALNELYEASRADAERQVPGIDTRRGFSLWGPSRAHKARVAYVGKSAQIFEIVALVPPQQLLIVEYDELVRSPAACFPRVFEFIGEPYDPACTAIVRADSVPKASRRSHISPSCGNT